MIGKTKITEKEKEVLRGLALYVCQGCKRPDAIVGKLEIHRITRGNAGGKYCGNNCLVICSKCHVALHQGEFR